MTEPKSDYLTEQQRKWFASLEAGLRRDTGRTLDEWILIAETCPETAHRARLKWFKETHGLAQNRASLVLSRAGSGMAGWSDGDALRKALWSDAAGLAILEAVEALVAGLDPVVCGQRKGFTAWSRRVQFAALRPLRGGGAMIGLALNPEDALGFEPVAKEAWSERLKVRARLEGPKAADQRLEGLITAAWSRS